MINIHNWLGRFAFGREIAAPCALASNVDDSRGQFTIINCFFTLPIGNNELLAALNGLTALSYTFGRIGVSSAIIIYCSTQFE